MLRRRNWPNACRVAERSGHVALGFDIGLIGFAESELERLLAGVKTGLTEDDDAPPLPEQAVTQPGDLWVLGEHRLLCGDATALADIERVLGGQLADMTFTDPPLVACPRQSAPEASDGGTPTAVAGTGGLRSGLTVSPGLRRARRAEGESPPLSKDSQLERQYRSEQQPIPMAPGRQAISPARMGSCAAVG